MRKIVLGSVAATSLVALAACGGEAPADDAATEETTEEVAAEEEAEAVEAEPVEEVAAVPPAEANGTVIEIQMLTRDPETGRQVFSPGVVVAQVGDTIRFVATNPTHQAESIPEMLPAGVTGWEGQINEEVEYVVPAPGIYGYKCAPHYAAGMVGVIVVQGEGAGDNLEAAKAVRHIGIATTAFEEYLAEAETMLN
ncbi:MAG: pseudoazurin [Pseudomonadota bacterium]